MNFKLPKNIYNEKQEIRTVGFEIEFSNVELDTIASKIKEFWGGEIHQSNEYSYEIKNTEFGKFTVEFDSRILSKKLYKTLLKERGINIENVKINQKNLEEIIEPLIEKVTTKVIPYEIICPPLPITDLHKIEPLREFLFESGAEGTKSSLSYVFSTHINPEAPNLNVESVLDYLKAFILLYPWLYEISEVDFLRSLSPYILPFPKEYNLKVLNQNYNPSLDQFIRDYYQFNPDRNRPLDLYPLIKFMDEETFSSLEEVKWVSARPTFHYRLPNSFIEYSNWDLSSAWNPWAEVELLAENKEKLMNLAAEYSLIEDSSFISFNKNWLEHLNEKYDYVA